MIGDYFMVPFPSEASGCEPLILVPRLQGLSRKERDEYERQMKELGISSCPSFLLGCKLSLRLFHLPHF